MESYLNRTLIIIIPKKPFYDWINYLDPVHTIQDLKDYDSLLLPDGNTFEDATIFIKHNYSLIFENHLFGMWTDENDWPQKRTLKIFNEWFDWHFSSMIMDVVENDPVSTESM